MAPVCTFMMHNVGGTLSMLVVGGVVYGLGLAASLAVARLRGLPPARWTVGEALAIWLPPVAWWLGWVFGPGDELRKNLGNGVLEPLLVASLGAGYLAWRHSAARSRRARLHHRVALGTFVAAAALIGAYLNDFVPPS
jgi:hypothetical protein